MKDSTRTGVELDWIVFDEHDPTKYTLREGDDVVEMRKPDDMSRELVTMLETASRKASQERQEVVHIACRTLTASEKKKRKKEKSARKARRKNRGAK